MLFIYYWGHSVTAFVVNYLLRLVLTVGAVDELNSPSARLTVGRVMKAGTGCFDVVVPLTV